MIRLAELHRDQKYVFPRFLFPTLTWRRNAKGLAEVITLSRSFMSSTAKAKTAKLSKFYFVSCWHGSMAQFLTKRRLVRTLLNYFNNIPNSRQVQIDVLMDNIDWSTREKRIFLKHSLEIRLVAL